MGCPEFRDKLGSSGDRACGGSGGMGSCLQRSVSGQRRQEVDHGARGGHKVLWGPVLCAHLLGNDCLLVDGDGFVGTGVEGVEKARYCRLNLPAI